MQEIKKRRIVIASVLKPVNDPRMFEKIGQSLSENYEVHVIGYPSEAKADYTSITLHTFKPFSRLSISRIATPFTVLKKILSIKPEVLIFCTHELLFTAVIAKALTRCKIIYDVQENYWRNILYGKTFPFLIAPFIALFVRFKEWITSPVVDYYYLAEKGYEKEIGFPGKKKTVIENKLKKPALPLLTPKSQHDGNIHLLFSGTLAETTGVFTAIEIAKQLHAQDQRIRLHIVGWAALPGIYERLKRETGSYFFITMEGGNVLVPHQKILESIQQADFGIISYPYNPSTANSIPTKLYEYLGYQLPVILINHQPWVSICEQYNAAIPFDPMNIQADPILAKMLENSFFSSIPQDVFWDAEEKKLIGSISHILPI